MTPTADQKRILRFIRRGPTTFAELRDKSAGKGCRWLTQDLLAELAVLEEAGLISLALRFDNNLDRNFRGKHIRATEAA